jgi:hypothetical protein
MAAIIYLGIAFILGFALTKLFFPDIINFVSKTYDGRDINISPLFIMLPMWFYLGIIPQTWLVYILSFLFKSNTKCMMIGNIATLLLVSAISAVILYFTENDRNRKKTKTDKKLLFDLKISEEIAIITVTALVVYLMYITLHVKDGSLYVGLSTFSDFSPHLSMIRAFSSGTNFPTQYTPYAGSDVKYHFMFQFLCGNLEYLGLRLDWAFNLPSTIGLLMTISAFYVFSVKFSGKRAAGILSTAMFLFRSSPSAMTYFATVEKGKVFSSFFHSTDFVGYTTNENWGLWNLNVYCNQRHLGFILGVMCIFVMFFVEKLYKGTARIAGHYKQKNITLLNGPRAYFAARMDEVNVFFRYSLFNRDGWRAGSYVFPVIAGAYIGMIAFWNGAVVIAALLVLFVLAIISDERLEFLICAVCSAIFVFLQSHAFIKQNAFSLKWYFGFIAENKTVIGVINYIWLLTGIVSIMVLIVFAVSNVRDKWLILSFTAPFTFAFTISMTIDPTVNHKYIMISLMLLSVPVADYIVKIWQSSGQVTVRLLIVCLSFALMITGIYEFFIVANKNSDTMISSNGLVYDLDDPTTAWIRKNTTSADIFLTSNYCMNNVVLAGASLYDGWEYYAWSAGYDTQYRDDQVAAMYSAQSVSELKELTKENNISYIIVDDDNRTSENYTLNEQTIIDAFEAVFTDSTRNLTIYRVE